MQKIRFKGSQWLPCLFTEKLVDNKGKMYYNKNVIQSKERYAKEHLTYG